MEKIKLFLNSDQGRNILIILIVILVSLASFQLGKLSVKYSQNSDIKVTYPTPLNDQSANAVSALESAEKAVLEVNTTNTSSNLKTTKNTVSAPMASKNFFASNRGRKYYPVGCSAGKTIKQENRIYFATRGEAEAAGYDLSSSCR